jgi:hypothetical protein
MLATYDWTYLVRYARRSGTPAMPVHEWLVDNANAGGWSKIKSAFERGLQSAKEDKDALVNLWFSPASDVTWDRNQVIRAMAARRLSSFGGGPKGYRNRVTKTRESNQEPNCDSGTVKQNSAKWVRVKGMRSLCRTREPQEELLAEPGRPNCGTPEE